MILPTLPLLQEDNNVMNVVLPLAITISQLNEKTLGTLSKQLYKSLDFIGLVWFTVNSAVYNTTISSAE